MEGTFWEGHFSGLNRTFPDSAWMLSLVSFLRFVEEVKIDPGSTLFFKGHSDQI